MLRKPEIVILHNIEESFLDDVTGALGKEVQCFHISSPGPEPVTPVHDEGIHEKKPPTNFIDSIVIRAKQVGMTGMKKYFKVKTEATDDGRSLTKALSKQLSQLRLHD